MFYGYEFAGKTCPYCKAEFKTGDAVKVCPVCEMPHHQSCWDENNGCTTFGCSEQNSVYDPPTTPGTIVSGSSDSSYSYSSNSNGSNDIVIDFSDDTPVLSTWKTSVGATIGGIILNVFLGRFPTPEAWWILDLVIGLGFLGFGIYYALGMYPSLFTSRPKLTNRTGISFLNGLLGGVIFGCIWNSNLTKKTKGISNVVYVFFEIGIVALTFLVSYFGYA